MMKTETKTPLHTLLTELTGWTLARTAGLPKSHRFTFGQRLDNLTLDALALVVRALYSPPAAKRPLLVELNLQLELLRVLWRLVHGQRWLSAQQLLFVNERIDEIGRMTGGWLRQLEGKATLGKPPADSASDRGREIRSWKGRGKSSF